MDHENVDWESLDDRLAGLLSVPHSNSDGHEDALMYQHQNPWLLLHLPLLNTTTNKSTSDEIATKIRSALHAHSLILCISMEFSRSVWYSTNFRGLCPSHASEYKKRAKLLIFGVNYICLPIPKQLIRR